MLDFLKHIDMDVDVIRFFPHEELDNALEVSGEKYLEPAEAVEGTSIGPAWHIILFQWDEEKGKVINQDKFDAILSEPREYISTLIPQDWYGIIARKTTKSTKIVNELFDNILKLC